MQLDHPLEIQLKCRKKLFIVLKFYIIQCYFSFFAGLLSGLFSLARYVLLLVGVSKEKPVLMLPHIVVEAGCALLLVLATLVAVVAVGVLVGVGAALAVLVVLGLVCAVVLHFLHVAVSHYKVLDARVSGGDSDYGKLY